MKKPSELFGFDYMNELPKKEVSIKEIALILIPKMMVEWGHLPGKFDQRGSERNTLERVLNSDDFKKYYKKIS